LSSPPDRLPRSSTPLRRAPSPSTQTTSSAISSPRAKPGSLTPKIFPAVGYTGDDTGRYAVRHNPLAYFTDVQNDAKQVQDLVPFSQLAADPNTANLPDYSFIVPNLCNDAHDCPLSTADTWLKTNIDPLIHSPQFQIRELLIIVFDEANTLDFTSGGGHVAAVIVSPLARRGYKSIAFYQHQSVLRLTLEGLGVTQLPAEAVTAPAMWEFFSTP